MLSGGRLCTENTTDISLWVNADGYAGYRNTSGGKYLGTSVVKLIDACG